MVPEPEQALRGTPSKLAFRALCGAVEEEQDFRTHRAEIWAELVADAQEFARRMMSGEIGWQP